MWKMRRFGHELMIMTFRGQLDLKKWKPKINSINLYLLLFCSYLYLLILIKNIRDKYFVYFWYKILNLCSYRGIEINMMYHNLFSENNNDNWVMESCSHIYFGCALLHGWKPIIYKFKRSKTDSMQSHI
jgi:hypothetical protein